MPRSQLVSIFPGKLLSDQTAGHVLKGSQINIFPKEYRNKNYPVARAGRPRDSKINN